MRKYEVKKLWNGRVSLRDYIVYETVEPVKGDTIQGNKILMKFENLPIQLKESHNLETMDNVSLLGRFAQWSHKMKANEVLDRVKEWTN